MNECQTAWCVVALIVTCVVGLSAYDVTQGQRELHDCATGQTVACEAAVAHCGDVWGDESRANLYRAAFKTATGYALPTGDK